MSIHNTLCTKLTSNFRPLTLLLLCIAAWIGTIAPAQAQTDTTRALRTDSSLLGTRPDTSVIEQDIRAGSYTVSASDLDADIAGQNVSGILRSSRDVFNATAGYNFGAARFRVRGLGVNSAP